MGELARLTNLSKPTVFRILQTLEKHKFVSCDFISRQYSLGITLFELGGIVSSSLSLRKAASRFLNLLQAKVSHAVLLGALDGGELMIIDKREGEDSSILTLEIGRKRPPHFGMLGKTLMAFLPEGEVDNLLRRYPLRKVASRSITDLEKFKRNLREIREKGYSYGNSESIEGVTGIGAPIRNHLGEVVAAVGTAFPTFSTNNRKIEKTIQLVTETAKEISVALGCCDIPRREKNTVSYRN
jgi:DNA-binding IclR family transcriptional regulator